MLDYYYSFFMVFLHISCRLFQLIINFYSRFTNTPIRIVIKCLKRWLTIITTEQVTPTHFFIYCFKVIDGKQRCGLEFMKYSKIFTRSLSN